MKRMGMALVVMVLLAVSGSVWAAKMTTATSNGNWNDAIWDNGAPAAGDTVTINSGVSVTLTNATPVLGVFTNNGTLTFTHWDTALTATDMHLVAGTVTHTGIDTNAFPGVTNRVWLVCSNLTVAASATINVFGRGFRGAVYVAGVNNAGQGPSPGFSVSGAAHGGRGASDSDGGTYGTIYGDYALPETAGSGGGINGSWNQGGTPQHGGGIVRIDASGHVSVNGTLRADGEWNVANQRPRSSGGSGGSILINCRTIAGTGTIRATGGIAGQYTGAGGGGRIAVLVQDSAAQALLPSSSLSFHVHGGDNWRGNNQARAERGTLYVNDSSILPVAWSTDASLYTPAGAAMSSLTVSNALMDLRIPDLTLAGGMTLSSNATVNLYHTDLSVGGGLSLDASRMNIYAAPTNGVTAHGASVSVGGDLIVTNTSWIYPYSDNTNGGSVFFETRNLFVASGSGFNADAAGFRGASAGVTTNGLGPGGAPVPGNNNGGGGGGYGGAGGNGHGGAGGPVYGQLSPESPTLPGSGGANTSTGPLVAGSGGGLMRIVVANETVLNGDLKANGGFVTQPGDWRGGGGSGGAIYLRTGTLSGAGAMSARGGWGRRSGGGGGGGRIAVWYMSNTFTGTPLPAANGTSVDGGYGQDGSGNPANPGAAGSVVWTFVPPQGTTVIIR